MFLLVKNRVETLVLSPDVVRSDVEMRTKAKRTAEIKKRASWVKDDIKTFENVLIPFCYMNHWFLMVSFDKY